MMAAEGPYLAALIARMPDPIPNLAAFGVAFAFAIILESPVIMLMSASTALIEDGPSYRALRRFSLWLTAMVAAGDNSSCPAASGLRSDRTRRLALPGRRGAADPRRPVADPAAVARRHRVPAISARGC